MHEAAFIALFIAFNLGVARTKCPFGIMAFLPSFLPCPYTNIQTCIFAPAVKSSTVYQRASHLFLRLCVMRVMERVPVLCLMRIHKGREWASERLSGVGYVQYSVQTVRAHLDYLTKPCDVGHMTIWTLFKNRLGPLKTKFPPNTSPHPTPSLESPLLILSWGVLTHY